VTAASGERSRPWAGHRCDHHPPYPASSPQGTRATTSVGGHARCVAKTDRSVRRGW
jgi:hypothetical protein